MQWPSLATSVVIVTSARSVEPIHVGALDAIHIVSALSLDRELAGVATYDHRMAPP